LGGFGVANFTMPSAVAEIFHSVKNEAKRDEEAKAPEYHRLSNLPQ